MFYLLKVIKLQRVTTGLHSNTQNPPE